MSIETNQQSVKKDFTNLSKQDIEILLQAVKEKSANLCVLQKKFDNITKEFYEQAVKDNHYNFQYIPKKFIIKEFCEQAVQNNCNNFEYVPNKFKTKKMQICFKLYTTHQLIIYYYYFKGLNQDLFTSHYHSSRRNWLRNKLNFLYAHLYACIFNIYLFSLNLKNNFI